MRVRAPGRSSTAITRTGRFKPRLQPHAAICLPNRAKRPAYLLTAAPISHTGLIGTTRPSEWGRGSDCEPACAAVPAVSAEAVAPHVSQVTVVTFRTALAGAFMTPAASLHRPPEVP